MRMKLKNLKKLISVAIICTMIAALFVPTLSVQAAETQALESAVENYTDVENSAYKINSVTHSYGTIYVDYTAPEDCVIIMAEYDGMTGLLVNISTDSVSASTNGSAYFNFERYSNCYGTLKLFIVDSYYRPLGKSFTQDYEINDYSEEASLGWDFDAQPHPTVPLKEDSGKYAYGIPWSVDTNGVLTLGGGYTYLYTSGEHLMPWDEYREGITSVVMADDMEYIGAYMFQGLSKVKEITIPADAYLYDYSFVDMSALETVILSSKLGYDDKTYSASEVTGSAFINCPSLKQFIVDENDEYYMTIDGVLYSKDGKTLIKYPAGKTDKTFTIPDSVTRIDSNAFDCAYNLESVYNVPDISGTHVFANCTSLKNVEIRSDIDTLNTSAFYNCSSLEQLNLPDTITWIYSCYDSYTHDTDVCNDFETTAIKSMSVPSNVRYTSDFVSALPGSLESLEVKADNSKFKLVDGVLFSTDMKTLYRYLGANERTSYTIPETVTSIGANAFRNCKNLKTIEIGSNVTSIGSNAFEGCVNLTDMTLTGIKTVESETFKDCINLKNVDLGSAVYIYRRAFYGCKSLESITIPASTTTIQNGIFINCDSLKAINVADGNTVFSTVDGCLYKGTVLMEYPNAKYESFVVPSDVTSINPSAFEGRASLKSVIIPDSVQYIGERAFAECSNLTDVSLPEGLGDLYSYLFYNCTSLSKINLPDTLYNISEYVFGNCTSLKSIQFPEPSQNDCLYLQSLSFYNAGLESIVFPEYISLNYNPFLSCYNLKTVKFNSGYNDYYSEFSRLFWNFDELTVYYPKGNATWTSTRMHNYQHKDSFTFIPFDDGIPDGEGSYTFTGLEPDCTYIVGISDGAVDYDLLSLSTLLYVDQLTSDSNGNLTMNYTIKNYTEKLVPFALGAAENDISSASVEVGEIVYSGRAQDKPDNYKVTVDGKELVEGVDYLVTYDSGFDGPGTFFLSVVGIGNYYGEVCQRYTVLGTEYDVDGDGMITIRDTTAIQFYLAGIRTPRNLYAADANGDGVISVADVTHIQKLLAGIC